MAGIAFFGIFAFHTQAQSQNNTLIKVNVSNLTVGLGTIQVERVLAKRFSITFGTSFRPKMNVPFAKTVEKYIDIADKRVDYISFENVKKQEAKYSQLRLTPEVRIYLGNKPAPYGPYLAFFGRYNYFRADVPVFLDVNYNNLPFRLQLPVDTKLKTSSYGVMLGNQFKLTNRLSLDCYWIGLHVGRAKVHGESIQDLGIFDENFRQNLRKQILDTFKINENYLSLDVSAKGVTIDNVRRLSYFNFRGLGFAVAYTF